MALQEYVQLKSDVANILQQYGTRFRLVRPVQTGQGVVADKTIATVFGTFDTQLIGYYNTTAGGLVATDKKTLYITPWSNKDDPQVADRLVEGKNTWRIISVDIYRPDGVTIIAYMLQVT